MGLFSGIKNTIGNAFGGNSQWKNPADAAKPWLDQIPGEAQQRMAPYAEAGQQSLPILQDQFSRLLNSPEFMRQIGSQYQQSPGFQWQLENSLKAAEQAAAAGGYAGTPAHQAQAMNYANGLANQDYQQYLNNVMGAYNTGLQGYGGLNQMGFNANSQMMNAIINQLMSQANLAYTGVENENQWNQNQNAAFGKALGSGLSFLGLS